MFAQEELIERKLKYVQNVLTSRDEKAKSNGSRPYLQMAIDGGEDQKRH